MDFSVAPETEALLERFRTLMRELVFPLERQVVAGSWDQMEPLLAAARTRAKELGLWAPQIGRELGGMGLDFLDHARVSEVLGASPLGHYVCGCQAPDAGNLEILHKYGTDAQKERFLLPLAHGQIRSCFSMTEPDRAGSNPTWLETKAEKSGDDYVITGRKWFTTGADGAAFAIVMAVTNPEAHPYGKSSMIIVPTDTPGFNRIRNISVMGHAGGGWASHSEIAYEGVRVPQSNRLGAEGGGFMIAQERLGPGRIHHCMRWIGIMERAFGLMCERAAHREIAPGKPLGTRQTVQEWIADSRAEIDAARLLVWHAAWRIDRDGVYEARQEISTIKFFVAGVLGKVLDRAIQVHGALGLTDDTPLATLWRHERAARIYDGPDEVHKSVVARRCLEQHGMARSKGEG